MAGQHFKLQFLDGEKEPVTITSRVEVNYAVQTALERFAKAGQHGPRLGSPVVKFVMARASSAQHRAVGAHAHAPISWHPLD